MMSLRALTLVCAVASTVPSAGLAFELTDSPPRFPDPGGAWCDVLADTAGAAPSSPEVDSSRFPLAHALAQAGYTPESFARLAAQERAALVENVGGELHTWMEPCALAVIKCLPQDDARLSFEEMAHLREDLDYLWSTYSPYLSEPTREMLAASRNTVFTRVARERGQHVQASAIALAATLTADPSPLSAAVTAPEPSYPRRLGADARAFVSAPLRWSQDDWIYVGGALVGTALLFKVDDNLLNDVQRIKDDRFAKALRTVEPFASEYSFVIPAAYYAHSRFFGGGESSLRTAKDSVQASLMAGTVVAVLKVAFGRERPQEGNGSMSFHSYPSRHKSFPSGHTAQAFALATAVALNSESPIVPYIAYTAAALAGLQRIYTDAHWPSDVFLGAAIGHYMATFVVNRNAAKKRGPFSNLTIVPDLERRALAVKLDF
jgi:membrane-associated phospholipid phosphatase